MSLKIKVEVKTNGTVNSRVQVDKDSLHCSYASVDDGSRLSVAVLVGVARVCRKWSCARLITSSVR